MKKNNAVRQIAIASVLGISLVAPSVFGQAATTFAPDQKVEVREGDEWSAATVTKKEGRKYQIKYEDGTEEWVTADRLRAPGAAVAEDGGGSVFDNPDGKADTAADGGAAKAPAAKAPAKPAFFIGVGMKVECKWGGLWREATVKQKAVNGWILVNYTPGPFLEWVEPWRIRKVGDKTDNVPRGGPNETLRKPEPPPRQPPGEAPTAEERKDPFAPKPYDKTVTDANSDKVEDLLSTGGAATLTAFDPVATKLAQRAYVLKGKAERNVQASALAFAGSSAMIAYVEGGGGNGKTSQVERVDLAGGAASKVVDYDPLSNPLAISPSGKRVIGAAHGFFPGTRNRVDLFDIGGAAAEPKHVISFIPYDGEKSTTDVDWAGFADDDHVLTCSSGGSLVLWDAPKATAEWRHGVLKGTVPVLSPGGKQLAFVTDDGLSVIDARTGKLLCSIAGSRPVKSLAFTPDGKRVVGSTGAVVTYWDLEKGELSGDIGVPTGSEKLAAVGPSHVLLGSGNLLDLDRKRVVRRYDGASTTGGHGGLAWGLTRDGNRSVLASAALPHPAATKLGAGGPLLLQPGGSVSIEVNVEGATEEVRQKIVANIEAQLRRNGISVAANQPIKVVARTEHGASETRTFERGPMRAGPFSPDPMGRPTRESETVTVTQKITRLSIESDGKVAWEDKTTGGTPWHVMSKEGQTIGQAVQAASTFNVGFLETARVPAYVMVPDPALGVSKWSITGVRDEK